jgi:DNA-binding transcriptional MerR regulator
MSKNADLTVSQVAKFAGCHPRTVLNYEKRGYIKPYRDNNNFRRYTKEDALKLKQILEIRRPAENEQSYPTN